MPISKGFDIETTPPLWDKDTFNPYACMGYASNPNPIVVERKHPLGCSDVTLGKYS